MESQRAYLESPKDQNEEAQSVHTQQAKENQEQK